MCWFKWWVDIKFIPKLCFLTLNWTSHCCEGHSQRQSSPFACPPRIVVLFSWRGGCCQDDRASSGSVKLSPKRNPNRTPSFEHATSEAALWNWWKPCASEKQGEAQTETKYRQIAREDHTDILGNNLEPVNFSSQAFFFFLRRQTLCSRSKLTWHIYPGLASYKWSPNSWTLLFFFYFRSLSAVWQVKRLK